MKRFLPALLPIILMTSCSTEKTGSVTPNTDVHSYAKPDIARVKNVDLDLEVLFNQHTIRGTAILTIEYAAGAKQIIVDTRKLQIDEVEVAPDAQHFREARFQFLRSSR